jgi:hypothetical protein
LINWAINREDVVINKQDIRNTQLNDIKIEVDKVLNKLDHIINVLAALDAKFIDSIPRLFVLYLADCKKSRKHPKSFIRNLVSDKFKVKIVCAHSLQTIEPPIKFRNKKD